MSQLSEAFAVNRDVVHEAQQPVVMDETSASPVLITEQEVMFGTHVALSARVAAGPRRFAAAIRTAAASLHLPPPHQHYPAAAGYLERSRMAREMERL